MALVVITVSCAAEVETRSIPGRAGGSPAVGARELSIRSSNFKFSTGKLRIKVEEEIALKLTSDDNAHDFAVDGLGRVADVSGGDSSIRRLRIDKPGRYTFFCTLPGHRDGGMEGTIVVEQ